MTGLRKIGTAPDGSPLMQATLRHGDETVTLLSYGCATCDWRVPLGGARVPVVLGHDDPTGYLTNAPHLGIIAGRVANRTARARFTLDGRRYDLDANEPPHHLHGGQSGTGHRNWQFDPDGGHGLRASCRIDHLEDGYPGAVAITALIRLGVDGLTYDLTARPDRPSPVNLAQHNYYNLMGGGAIWDHSARIAAHDHTPTDAQMIPTGHIEPVAGTRYDLTQTRSFATADRMRQGTDVNLVLDPDRDSAPAAEVTAPNGLHLRLWTDQPGMQLYTGGGLPGAPAQGLRPFGGFCLEPQGFPDALNQPGFPSIICTPDQPYRQTTRIQIGP